MLLFCAAESECETDRCVTDRLKQNGRLIEMKIVLVNLSHPEFSRILSVCRHYSNRYSAVCDFLLKSRETLNPGSFEGSLVWVCWVCQRAAAPQQLLITHWSNTAEWRHSADSCPHQSLNMNFVRTQSQFNQFSCNFQISNFFHLISDPGNIKCDSSVWPETSTV